MCILGSLGKCSTSVQCGAGCAVRDVRCAVRCAVRCEMPCRTVQCSTVQQVHCNDFISSINKVRTSPCIYETLVQITNAFQHNSVCDIPLPVIHCSYIRAQFHFVAIIHTEVALCKMSQVSYTVSLRHSCRAQWSENVSVSWSMHLFQMYFSRQIKCNYSVVKVLKSASFQSSLGYTHLPKRFSPTSVLKWAAVYFILFRQLIPTLIKMKFTYKMY